MKTNCSHKLCIILWVRLEELFFRFIDEAYRLSLLLWLPSTFYFTVLHACLHFAYNIIILIKFIKMMMASRMVLSVKAINQIHTHAQWEGSQEEHTLNLAHIQTVFIFFEILFPYEVVIAHDLHSFSSTPPLIEWMIFWYCRKINFAVSNAHVK